MWGSGTGVCVCVGCVCVSVFRCACVCVSIGHNKKGGIWNRDVRARGIRVFVTGAGVTETGVSGMYI